MKTLLLSLILALTACQTVPPGHAPTPEQIESVNRTSAIVEMSSQLAVYGTLRHEPDARPYFESAVLLLNSAISRGEYNPDALIGILSKINVDNKDREVVYITTTAALNLYRIIYADAVDKKLDQNIYVRPVLEALTRGIQLGLNSISTENKFNLKRR